MKGKQCFIPSPWRSFLHLCWRRQLLPGHQTLGANQPLPSEARKRPRTTPLCLKGSLHTSRHPPQGHSLHCKHTLGAAIQWTWSTTLGRLVHVACCLTERGGCPRSSARKQAASWRSKCRSWCPLCVRLCAGRARRHSGWFWEEHAGATRWTTKSTQASREAKDGDRLEEDRKI